MRFSGRRWFFVALALGAVATLAPVAMRFLGRHRPRFPYYSGTLSPAAYAALAGAPGWSAASAAVAPGITLNGLVRRPTTSAAPWVLFFPGNDSTPLATSQKFLERLGDGRDWGLAVYAYRGYDSSNGTPSVATLTADATQVFYGLLQRERLDPSRVHLVAFSLGGYLATAVAGTAARAEKKAASLSLLASVESIVMVRPSWSASLGSGDIYDTQPLLDAVPAPVLVVQGSEDEALGVEQGRAIANRLGRRARYLELAGVRHNPLLETEAEIAAAREMIESTEAARKPP